METSNHTLNYIQLRNRTVFKDMPHYDVNNVHNMQTRSKERLEENEFYKEFQQIFEKSKKEWRKNKTHIGNGCFTYKET